MARHYFIGYLVLLACCLLEALPQPTVTRNNEETTPLSVEKETDINNKDERSLMYEEGPQGNTKEIVERIKAINDALNKKKPTKRPQINWNTQPQTGGGYIMDKDVLEKLQQIIASGKLHPFSHSLQSQEHNLIPENNDLRYSRKIPIMPRNQDLPIMPIPYMMNMPVLVMPQNINGYNMLSPQQFSPLTRQGPEPPASIFGGFGNLQWPFASWFPILIRDPLLSMINGGGWSNFIQTGQEADVCRRQKTAEIERSVIHHVITDENEINHNIFQDQVNDFNGRQGRAIKKRTMSQETTLQETDEKKKSKKIYSTKQTTTRKPVKRVTAEQDTKTVNSDSGDLRFPFGEFSFFGNKKPVAPSPGILINKMKVRRGGVAIAGPGGVATAGRGGTAIVGPGGLAYTQPGGLAIAGPHARVVALSHDADLHSIISRLQEQKGSVPRSLQAIPEGKIVATDSEEQSTEEEDLQDDQMSTTTMEATTQYLPFYGGAKGQYLEIKKNTAGSVISEKIVSEDKISNDNVVKNSDENLLSKVLAANLQMLRSISTNILKLHTLGRKTGRLGSNEKNRFKNQLVALGEAASNTIKLVDEIGDNVDTLFVKNATQLRQFGGSNIDDDDVGEEGVGIDADETEPSASFDYDNIGLDGGTIAEAKPIGLAVIGESGLASSRPHGIAVARHGVAISQPMATAIAGINPAELGITFPINHNKN